MKRFSVVDVGGVMHEASVLPIYSPEFAELSAVFYKLEQPYGLNEIIQFNQVYERVYQKLRREEKVRAEVFVDTLISCIEAPYLACKIFGVV